ncbi:MAG: helix-turn-helix transcriptional regulator [Flammeovirgaceae bacterium]
MITREELLRSPEYWFEHAQNELYRQVVEYKEKKGINQTELAKELGVTKGYVSQILKGEFNYTLKKLIEISLAFGKIPQIEYKTVVDIISEDERTRYINANTDDLDGFNKFSFQLSSNSSSVEVSPPMVVIQPHTERKTG